MPRRPRRCLTPGIRSVRKWATSPTRCRPAVQGPYFNDEFGDVYTNIYALSGDGFSPAQLHDYAERLRTELLRVPDVNKVDFIADQEQRVYVEIANAQLAKLGLTPSADRGRRQRAKCRRGRRCDSRRRTIGFTCGRAVSSRTSTRCATR